MLAASGVSNGAAGPRKDPWVHGNIRSQSRLVNFGGRLAPLTYSWFDGEARADSAAGGDSELLIRALERLKRSPPPALSCGGVIRFTYAPLAGEPQPPEKKSQNLSIPAYPTAPTTPLSPAP